MHEEQGGVRHLAEAAERLNQVMRCFEPAGIEDAVIGFEALPAGQADAHARRQACLTQQGGKGAELVARLAHEAEGLPQLPLKQALGRLGIGIALIAGKQHRQAAGKHQQERLLETGVMAGGPGEVRHMLAVAVDDEGAEAMKLHPFTEPGEARLEEGPPKGRLRHGFAVIGQFNASQNCMPHGWPPLSFPARIAERCCPSSHCIAHM